MRASRRIAWSFVLLAACGPTTSSGSEGGPSDGTDTSTTAGSMTSMVTGGSSTAVTGDGSTSASNSTTAGPECPEPTRYFVPGCDGPDPGDAAIDAGCYETCSDDMPCTEGVCATAWIDPCYGLPCDACGGQQDLCLPGLPTGVTCMEDEQCLSGVCWDFNDYDECCFGTVCSGLCESDQECVDLAQEANAPSPDGASCGGDGRCDLVGTGLGSFACAGGPKCG